MKKVSRKLRSDITNISSGSISRDINIQKTIQRVKASIEDPEYHTVLPPPTPIPSPPPLPPPTVQHTKIINDISDDDDDDEPPDLLHFKKGTNDMRKTERYTNRRR